MRGGKKRYSVTSHLYLLLLLLWGYVLASLVERKAEAPGPAIPIHSNHCCLPNSMGEPPDSLRYPVKPGTNPEQFQWSRWVFSAFTSDPSGESGMRSLEKDVLGFWLKPTYEHCAKVLGVGHLWVTTVLMLSSSALLAVIHFPMLGKTTFYCNPSKKQLGK